MNERAMSFLLTVPVEMRDAVKQEAHYIMNCTGGRYSDAMDQAVRYWHSKGLEGFTSPTARKMAENVS